MGAAAKLSVEVEYKGRRYVYSVDVASIVLEGRWRVMGFSGRFRVENGVVKLFVEGGAASYVSSLLHRQAPRLKEMTWLAELFSCTIGLPVELHYHRLRLARIECRGSSSGE